MIGLLLVIITTSIQTSVSSTDAKYIVPDIIQAIYQLYNWKSLKLLTIPHEYF